MKNLHLKKLKVAEMRMLVCGVMEKDKIRNERTRGAMNICEISQKVQGSQLKWLVTLGTWMKICR